MIGEGFVRDQLLLRANSLAYLTLLSIVPLLAIAVALVDMIGDGQDIAARILELVGVSASVKQNLLAGVASFNFRAFGSIGGGILLGTTVLAVGRVEQSLNAVWGVTERRPWSRRIPDYLAVLVIAPLLVGVAVPLRAAFESQTLVREALEYPALQFLYTIGLRWAPLVLVIAALCFLYWFLPNTRVRRRSAVLGGVVAGILFNWAQVAYVGLSVGANRLDKAFAASAWVVLFLVWVYISWAIVLLGAEVAYAHQTLALYRREVRGRQAGPAAREAIGLAIALACARAFREGAAAWQPDALSDALDVPLRTVREVLRALEQAGVITPAGGEHAGGFQMAQPAERVRVADVLTALRGPRSVSPAMGDLAETVSAVLADVDRAGASVAEARTLRDLLGHAERS